MKMYHWLIALLLLCNVQFVCAQNYSHDYSNDFSCTQDDCCCDLNGSLYGDFLWWKVCRHELGFETNGTTHFVKPSYDSGFRIGGSVACDCIDFGVRYTSYLTGKSKTNPDEPLEHIKYHFDYDVVDFELGFSFHVDCACGTVRPFAGVKLAEIDEKFDSRQFNNDVLRLDFSGTGLYVGAEGNFNVHNWQRCGCGWSVPISLAIRASTGILDGEFAARSVFSSITIKKECLFVPVRELYVGAEFELNGCFSCANPVLRIGYEVQSWAGWTEFERQGDRDDLALLGLGGLVLGLEADF